MLYKALQKRLHSSNGDWSNRGIFGFMGALPPSNVLLQFVQLYAVRIDPILPYLGLAGSPSVKINDILQINCLTLVCC